MQEQLAQFLAEVVLTSHYLAEPRSRIVGELSDAEMRCLRIIALFGPLNMHDVAARLGATKPRATQLVALLEAHGMVARAVAQDRRVIKVSTTTKGDEAIARLRDRYAKLAMAIQTRLGPQDTQKLCRLLEEITPLPGMVVD